MNTLSRLRGIEELLERPPVLLVTAKLCQVTSVLEFTNGFLGVESLVRDFACQASLIAYSPKDLKSIRQTQRRLHKNAVDITAKIGNVRAEIRNAIAPRARLARPQPLIANYVRAKGGMARELVILKREFCYPTVFPRIDLSEILWFWRLKETG